MAKQTLAAKEANTVFPFPEGHTVNIQTDAGNWRQGVWQSSDGKEATLTIGSVTMKRALKFIKSVDFEPGEEVQIYDPTKKTKDGKDLWVTAKIVQYRSSIPRTPDQLKTSVIDFTGPNPKRHDKKGQQVKLNGRPVTVTAIKVCPKNCANVKARRRQNTSGTKNARGLGEPCKVCFGTGLDSKRIVYYFKGWAAAGPQYYFEHKDQNDLTTNGITQAFYCKVQTVNGEKLGKDGVLPKGTCIRKVGANLLESTEGGYTFSEKSGLSLTEWEHVDNINSDEW